MEMDVLKFDLIIFAVMFSVIIIKILNKSYHFNEEIIEALDLFVCIIFGIGVGATWFRESIFDIAISIDCEL